MVVVREDGGDIEVFPRRNAPHGEGLADEPHSRGIRRRQPLQEDVAQAPREKLCGDGGRADPAQSPLRFLAQGRGRVLQGVFDDVLLRCVSPHGVPLDYRGIPRYHVVIEGTNVPAGAAKLPGGECF